MLHPKTLRTQIDNAIIVHVKELKIFVPLRAKFNLTKIKSIIFLQYQ